MLRQRQINADSGGRSGRFLRAVADVVRWPFERLAWSLERRIVWPLRERLAGRGTVVAPAGWRPSGRIAGGAALATVAAAAILGGVLLAGGKGGAANEETAAPARIAQATPPASEPVEKPSRPVLHGVTPSFGVAKGTAVAGASGDEGGSAAAPPDGEVEAGEAESAAEALDSLAEEGSAAASSAKPVPAGPAAMKVARRFADAFVFYEIGKRPARAKAIFAETATPQLAEALAERPPRLPQDAEVPKAKVLNLVPGPRHGKAYTVSASLLRVGLTSELRLEMKRQEGEWLVTDVRG